MIGDLLVRRFATSRPVTCPARPGTRDMQWGQLDCGTGANQGRLSGAETGVAQLRAIPDLTFGWL